MDEPGIPADASSLIYLAKADLLREMHTCLGPVVVPTAVWAEAVDAGERTGRADPSRIRSAVDEGWLRMTQLDQEAANEAHAISTRYGLGRGESQVLAVATRGLEALLDDRRALRAAASMSVRPIRTIRLPELGCVRGCWSAAVGLGMLRSLSVIVAVRADALSTLEHQIRRRPR